jgi:hypothetical protein
VTDKPYTRAFFAGLLLALSGCFYNSTIVPYPREWQSEDGARIGDCPDLGGRYAEKGDKYIESGAVCAASGEARSRKLWNCSLALPENLAGRIVSGNSWEIHQPGENTLTLTPVDESGARGESIELARKQDFECVGGRLLTHNGGSMFGGPAATAVGVLLLSGGHNSLDRSFTRNRAGELVMEIRESGELYHLVVGGVTKGSSYVRWLPRAVSTGASP